MRTREEIEAKIAEIDATETDKGLSLQNVAYRDELNAALDYVDSLQEVYGWEAAAVSWANGDSETLRIVGEVEPPGEIGPNA